MVGAMLCLSIWQLSELDTPRTSLFNILFCVPNILYMCHTSKHAIPTYVHIMED